ncbi:hypothetical protein [Gimesia algae]|uniref:Uncharacterized protein n=1 Tax=Gimesia algae TaxID=2527971 RepID=A0A517VC38_9PLAN|nr:hypothetical protein [Gimesia algae]QDT90567.1 hypothetical protein Pan161_22200 [Gimesia algae]
MQAGVELDPGNRRGPHKLVALGVCLLSLISLSACTGFRSVVPAPLVFEEQSAKILEIAPLGTPKEQAIRKLDDAGISGDFASSPSIYYCDLWQREDGALWHLNVALLFQEDGTLYKTRPAQADISWEKGASATEQAQP